MDGSFEEKMEMMKNISSEEMMKKFEEMKEICKNYCGECPSYTGTGETELVFCSTGSSAIIRVEKGCLCPNCPVTRMMSLRWEFYCTRGSAKEQAGIE